MQVGHLYDNWQEVMPADVLADIAGFDMIDLLSKRNGKMIEYAITKGVSILNVIDCGFESPLFNFIYYDDLVVINSDNKS